MELALIENLQRQDLNPVEEALGYQSLLTDYGLTQEEAAQRVGKSRPAVANALRLLNLEAKILEMVKTGALSPGHARAILRVKDPKKQREAAQKIAALDLSVRQAEALCRNHESGTQTGAACPGAPGGLCGGVRKNLVTAPGPRGKNRQRKTERPVRTGVLWSGGFTAAL